MKKILIALFMLLIGLILIHANVKADDNWPPIKTTHIYNMSKLYNVQPGTINEFIMNDGDVITVPSLNNRDLKINILTNKTDILFDMLPEQNKLLDSISVDIFQNQKRITELTKDFNIFFNEEDVIIDTDFCLEILYWNGTIWESISNNSLTVDTNKLGIYALTLK
jgi:hypothetical protein